jgi:hypothetical protein
VVATRWLVPAATLAATSTSQLSIANPSPTESATVSVRRQGGGAATAVEEATALVIAPGARVTLDLLAAGFTGTDSVEVASDIPVVVGQWLTFSTPADVATPLGVPVAGTQTVPESVVGPEVAGEEQLSTDELAPTETLVDPDSVPDADAPIDTTADTTASGAEGSSTTTTTSTGG